jgi:hypothetical protein
MPQSDWVIATDDLLCERWRSCLLCGARRLARGDLHTVHGLALAVMLCAACHRRDRARTEVQALLAARYGALTTLLDDGHSLG